MELNVLHKYFIQQKKDFNASENIHKSELNRRSVGQTGSTKISKMSSMLSVVSQQLRS